MAKITKKTIKKAKPVKTTKVVAKQKPQKKVLVKTSATKRKPSAKKTTPIAKKSISKKVIAKKTVVKKSLPLKKIAPLKITPQKKVLKKHDTKKKIGVKNPLVKKVVKVKENKKTNKKKADIKKPVLKKASNKIVKEKNIIVKKGNIIMKGISDVEKKIIVAKTIERKIKIKKPEKIQTIEKKQKTQEKGDISIEKKLKALINLQQIDSQIDKIRIIRGELPLEVQDLEDEIAGIQTRIENYTNEVNAIDEAVAERKNAIKQCQTLIKKYEAQQSNVRNNREYDSLSKEIEFQNLEIQLCEKRIKEYKVTLETKKEIISSSQKQLDEKLHDAKIKKAELNDIVEETEKEESTLLAKSKGNQKIIEERLLTAYKKIRKNARNGLAVVVVERDACGGCFNKIPPQRQLDIRIRKKIIVCEYCGRILVDSGIIQS
jgi:hypothetical protein